MKFSEFYRKYSDEKSCVKLLRTIIEPEIKACKKCSSKSIYCNNKLCGWRCKVCRFRMTLKSISFMKDSNLSYVDWVELMFLSTYGKKPLSVNEITRVSRQSRYDTVAYALKKIRQLLMVTNQKLPTDYVSELFLVEPDSENQSNSIDRPNLPKSLFIHISKSKKKGNDKIHFSLNLMDKKALITKLETGINKLPKIFPIVNTESTDKIVKLSVMWEKKLKENFIKNVKGTYHNISLIYLKGMLAEYAFKYNYRKENRDKLMVFLDLIAKSLGQNSA